MSNLPSTTPNPATTDVTEVSAALKVVLAAIAVLEPGAGVALAIIGGLVALAPIATPEVEKIVALLKGQAPPATGPITPAIEAEMAPIVQELETPIAPSEPLGGAS